MKDERREIGDEDAAMMDEGDQGPLLSVGQCASLACVLGTTAPCPGNVHRGADAEHVSYADYIVSAVVLGPAIDGAAAGAPVGRAVLSAVAATERAVGINTYLGTILLLVPLAKVPRHVPLAAGIGEVLRRLDAEDSRLVYEAIRLARPGGLGRAPTADVADEAPAELLEAMRLAAGWDSVARQYAEDFGQVLGLAASWLNEGIHRGWSLSDTIVRTHVRLMSELPDSLIARKCGRDVARRAADHAAAVLAAGQPGDEAYRLALSDLDFWLRSDPGRNPGTTADLVAAGLFAALRDGIIEQPYRL
jgi:triphosphoribosyl-dephospho-CoA synthase